MITYRATATGLVLGRCWGGSEGFYPTVQLSAPGDTPEDCIKDIENQAEILLASGGLDSGMGFESLVNAVLKVVVTAHKTDENGREWASHELDEMSVIGKLSDAKADFAADLLNS